MHYQNQKEIEDNYSETIKFVAHKMVSLVMDNALQLSDLNGIVKTLINPIIELPNTSDLETLISSMVHALYKACPYWFDDTTTIVNIIEEIEDVIKQDDSTSGYHNQPKGKDKLTTCCEQSTCRVDITYKHNHPLEKEINCNGHQGMFPFAEIQQMKDEVHKHQEILDKFFDDHTVGYKEHYIEKIGEPGDEASIAYVYFNPQGMDKKAFILAGAHASSSISRMQSKQYSAQLLDLHQCQLLYDYLHKTGSTNHVNVKKGAQLQADIESKAIKTELPDHASTNEDRFTNPTVLEDSQPHDLNSKSVVTGCNQYVFVSYTVPPATPFCCVCPMIVSKLKEYDRQVQIQEQLKPFQRQSSCDETNGYDNY